MMIERQENMEEEKKPSLEDMFLEIEQILEKMEDKDVSLEESFLLYEDGMKKLKQCNDRIDMVEKKMLAISAEGTLEEF